MAKKNVEYREVLKKANEMSNEWTECYIERPTASQLIQLIEQEFDVNKILLNILNGKSTTINGKKILEKVLSENLREENRVRF
ncbi:hypothetical protein [Bacillus sp. T33-2]|uniref:hypothetical protein n=1 Tax=Bacillus sp. T33-2 TaxID=2054168 RepID=UPI000C778008|nr:hypothetical protein [Bacillus sp. T33-2]PLR99612.1 hypothetical protein CVD19_00690 [Bacillus sp. T33-2]